MKQSNGLVIALLSAAAFGTSGIFASTLLDAGWSPAAALTARLITAALALTVPALLQLRGQWGVLRSNAGTILVTGLVAVVGCQLFFFNAIERIPVGVALLVEYLGVLLVVGWLWAAHGQRPRRLTVSGGIVAITGLVLVLDVTGTGHLDLVGVLWALAAAVGLAAYFTLAARSDQAGPPVPPLVLAWGSITVGAVVVLITGQVGLPLHATWGDVTLVHHQVSWIVPALGVGVVSTALAYSTGIAAARLLGSKLASFVGLSEVLAAVVFAALFLDQIPTAMQLAGGVLLIAGVALVRLDELRTPDERLPEPVLRQPEPSES